MIGRFDDSPTPEDAMRAIYALGGIAFQSHWYDDEIFLDLLHQLDEATDINEANAILKKMMVRTLTEIPEIVFPGPSGFRVAWPWVMNYEGEITSSYICSIELHQIIWID